jgi:hypothetical protein
MFSADTLGSAPNGHSTSWILSRQEEDVRINALPVGMDQPLQAALGLLLRALCYARDVGADPWAFAVDVGELLQAGASQGELRWLLTREYVEHRLETTPPDSARRTFRRLTAHHFPGGTCFVLTPVGAEAAEELLRIDRNHVAPVPGRFTLLLNGSAHRQPGAPLPVHSPTHELVRDEPSRMVLKPRWDAERHELWYAERLVKRFKWPASNQETILAAFEEEAWPARIDDPLPPQPEQDPKRRLHDTIKCLNRNHATKLLRFRGDGTGEGVIWDLLPPKSADPPR